MFFEGGAGGTGGRVHARRAPGRPARRLPAGKARQVTGQAAGRSAAQGGQECGRHCRAAGARAGDDLQLAAQAARRGTGVQARPQEPRKAVQALKGAAGGGRTGRGQGARGQRV